MASNMDLARTINAAQERGAYNWTDRSAGRRLGGKIIRDHLEIARYSCGVLQAVVEPDHAGLDPTFEGRTGDRIRPTARPEHPYG
jgi:hypothetical protein